MFCKKNSATSNMTIAILASMFASCSGIISFAVK